VSRCVEGVLLTGPSSEAREEIESSSYEADGARVKRLE
jgi:hypothetical protein